MTKKDKGKRRSADENISFAKSVIAAEALSPKLLEQLSELTITFGLSMRSGDLLNLSGGWYVTHTGPHPSRSTQAMPRHSRPTDS